MEGVGGEEDQPGRHQHLSQGLANNRSVNEFIFIVCFIKRIIFQPKSILNDFANWKCSRTRKYSGVLLGRLKRYIFLLVGRG